MPIIKEISYSDIDMTLNPHPVSGQLVVLKNAEAVKQSVKILVLTQFYERPYRPFLGSNVRHYLFDNMTKLTASNIRDEIRRVIVNNEPRADVVEVLVSPDIDRNGFQVKITFKIINLLEPVVVDLFLKRAR